jgi:hypothetical protein
MTSKTYSEKQRAWLIMADLFLDTDYNDAELGLMARRLSELPFSPDELDALYRKDVSPICSWNLYQVAGEWAGFDEEWLIAEIEKPKNPFNLARLFGAPTDWPIVLQKIRKLKEDAEGETAKS